MAAVEAEVAGLMEDEATEPEVADTTEDAVEIIDSAGYIPVSESPMSEKLESKSSSFLIFVSGNKDDDDSVLRSVLRSRALAFSLMILRCKISYLNR